MPIQGGGKGKPGAGAASVGAEPGAKPEAAEAAVVVAAPLGRERAAKEQEQEVSESREGSSIPPTPWPTQHPTGSPALVDGGATASPELGGGGTGGKGPMGGHSGNMPGGKGGRRPWGTAERRQDLVRQVQSTGKGPVIGSCALCSRRSSLSSALITLTATLCGSSCTLPTIQTELLEGRDSDSPQYCLPNPAVC